MVRTIAWLVIREHERLKEPSRVSQMPLWRAAVWAGLQKIIVNNQWVAQPFTHAPDRLETISGRLPSHWRCNLFRHFDSESMLRDASQLRVTA